MWGLIRAWIGIIISKLFSGGNDKFSSAVWREEKKNELNINTVLKFVREEGFIPELVDQNTLRFKCQGDIHLIGVSENNFIQVVKGFNLDAQDARSEMREAAMIAMAEIRCCKVIVTAETVSFAIETYAGKLADFAAYFHIHLEIIDASCRLFVDRLDRIYADENRYIRQAQLSGIC